MGDDPRPADAAIGEGPDLRRGLVVVGLGVTGRAVVSACRQRRIDVAVVDDAPGEAARVAAAELGVDLVTGADQATIAGLLAGRAALAPSPGVPDHHPAFTAAAELGLPVISEFDLAQRWDPRPVVAITGTDGKTTVTTMVTDMLNASGRTAVAVGNTDIPLISAISDPAVEVFVAEASSFRLGHSCRFSPVVGTWLNFAPDHLDVHASLERYEAAKAKIWDHLPVGGVAIANIDDEVVMAHAPEGAVTFGGARGDWHVADDLLVGDGLPVLEVSDLWRTLPHDLTNVAAAAATAFAAGATLTGIRDALRSFRGLAHRVELVAEAEGVRWYDDSKATAPHATVAAVAGFESVVLIAGGRNKGLDLGAMASISERLRGVVAIGDSASEVEAAFAGRVPVVFATSMAAAVEVAAGLAEPGDAVVLSPGCASFDWYRNYGERGDDFAREVRARLGRR